MVNTMANGISGVGRAAALLMVLALAACAGGGQLAYEPAPGSYFLAPAEPGDTVASLAKRYRVGEDDIIAFNNLSERDPHVTARTVRIPAYGKPPAGLREEPRRFARNAPVDSRPLGTIAAPATRGAGRVNVTQSKSAATAKAVKSPVMKPARPVQTAKLDVPKTKPVAAPATAAIAPAASEPAPIPQSRTAPPPPGHKFLWPVTGQVLSRFGAGADGARNDGINILTPRGTPVRAADAGIVTYVGAELKGYGNLVLIRHDNGYVTAYAHSDTVTVARGDKVTRGQPIAYAGSTGGVNEPQLHFELRYNTKPVDPALYLDAAARS